MTTLLQVRRPRIAWHRLAEAQAGTPKSLAGEQKPI
jgi:hypothetical protein